MKILQLGLAVALASGMAAIIVYITGVSHFCLFWHFTLLFYEDGGLRISNVDSSALLALQSSFRKCVNANGLGLQAVGFSDHCQVTIKFPGDTVSMWPRILVFCPRGEVFRSPYFNQGNCSYCQIFIIQVLFSSLLLLFIMRLTKQKDPKSGEFEGLSFDFNLCEAIATWEQVRNSTTVLTKEFIDALPNGWEEYAWRRINKGVFLNRCENKTLCMEKLSLVLPETPPFMPKEFGRCAVVGNSGDLLKTKFGDEIDGYDAVIRENGAPIQNYTTYVGRKSTFRLLNRGSAKALDKVVELDETRKEVLVVKTTIHDIMNKMIREIPIRNPVYLMLGTSFGSAAKGTGLKALEFALSICDTVDMYGFTVDPGYNEWTRYFSESRQGHTPLYGRAYYQMMECLGLVKIHSPMRDDFKRLVEWLPSPSTLEGARIASEKLLRWVGAGTRDPLSACTIIKRRDKGIKPDLLNLCEVAVKHQQYVKGATMYPLERSPGHGKLCMIPDT